MHKTVKHLWIPAAALAMLGTTAMNSAFGQTAFMEPNIDANATFTNTAPAGIRPAEVDYLASAITVGAYWDFGNGMWVPEQITGNDYGFPTLVGFSTVYIGGVEFDQTAVGTPGFSLITTIYGDNLNGASGGFLLGGKNAADPDFTDSGENIVGVSSKAYQSFSAQSLTFSQMQTQFPDFDFSNPLFEQPSTGVVPADAPPVYDVFQTLVPTSDLAISVPEPVTLTSALAGVGILALSRRKQAGPTTRQIK